MTETRRIQAAGLQAFIARAFEAVGVPSADAKAIAELMTRADVNGSEGHGVFRLPQYIRRIKGGAVNVCPDIRVEREAAAMALVNGDNGMGHLVMRFATGESGRAGSISSMRALPRSAYARRTPCSSFSLASPTQRP